MAQIVVNESILHRIDASSARGVAFANVRGKSSFLEDYYNSLRVDTITRVHIY